MNPSVPRSLSRWRETWPDALAFGAGLGLAWWGRWQTTDLVWSLWLSSLLLGYAVITWNLFSAPVLLARERRRGAAVGAFIGAGFMLAFFTVHFGLFHVAHAAILNTFFPVNAVPTGGGLLPLEIYGEVVRRYGWFVPAALVAERHAFRLEPLPPAPPPLSVKADDIARRQARNARLGLGAGVFRPYKNVVRLHLLIFFFAAANFAHLDGFFVYALVYTVYFFPWRVLLRPNVTA